VAGINLANATTGIDLAPPGQPATVYVNALMVVLGLRGMMMPMAVSIFLHSAGLVTALGGGLEWFGPGDRSDPVASQQTVYTLIPARGCGTAGIYIVGDLLDAIEQVREPLATGADLVRALAFIPTSARPLLPGSSASTRCSASAGRPI